MPLIPGVSDSRENLEVVARLCAGAKRHETVELLSHHKTADAKYAMAGMSYAPEFDPDAPVRPALEHFERLGVL